jgi:hypothetical protein
VDRKPTPGDSPLNELPEVLRQAVDNIRAAPVPADALDRALAKAEKISAAAPTLRRYPLRWTTAAAAIAAGLMLAVGLWQFVSTRDEPAAVAASAGLKADAKRAAEAPPAMNRPARGSIPHPEDVKDPWGAYQAKEAAPRAAPVHVLPQARNADIEMPKVQAAPGQVDFDGAAARQMQRNREPAEVMHDLPPAAPEAVFRARAGLSVGAGAPAPAADQAAAAAARVQQMEESMRRVPGSVSKDDYEAARNAARNSPQSGQRGGEQNSLSTESLDEAGRKGPMVGGGFFGRNGNSKGMPVQKNQNNKQDKALSPFAKKTEEKSKVWRNTSGRPTFARVYVGDGNSLELVSLDVNVTIQGPRARTVVDHVFRNPNPRQLEGTFEYPLPSAASPSYFAMFLGQSRPVIPPRFARRGADREDKGIALPEQALVDASPERWVRDVNTTDWGRLQEARIVGKDKALETYEDVVRGRIDPALLEYASGNTFRGRVFPIPASGYNRVVIAYEELLPITQGKMVYHFPLPDQSLSSLNVSLQASESECRERDFQPTAGTTQQAAGRAYYRCNWVNEQPPIPEVLFTCTPAVPDVQAVSGRRGENGPRYVYARVRPELPEVPAEKGASDRAVFLLDTSLSEQGDRFGISMKLMRAILESDPAIKEFNVVAFNAAATWVEKGWLPNTVEGRDSVFRKLDGIVLEGATNVGAALECLCKPPAELPDKAAVDCFLLSDGHVTWGETEVATLVAGFESRCRFSPRFHCYLTGLGAENTELFEALTRRGGGVFGCRSEADLRSAAVAHRNKCLRVERVRFVGGPAASDVLVAGRRAAVYPGGELVVAGKFQATGPTTLLVEGTFAREPFAQKFPVVIKDGGELAARGWAEIAVASLLALNDPKLDPLVTACCQQFNVGSRVASFLVLENEADYKRFNLEDERGKKVAGDLAAFLDKMWESLAVDVSARQSFLRFLERVEAHPNLLPGTGRLQVRKLVSILNDVEFEMPKAPLAGAIVRNADVPPEYLAGRAADLRASEPYLAESRRRADGGDVDGAVRVLSSIIEEHPSRGDALRLVGYRLLDLKQPAQAARLFERVQRQRPFEPHSYRDLARALEETDNFALAAVQYEIILGSVWHNRFAPSLRTVAQEEYTSMMHDALRRGVASPTVAGYFTQRLATLSQAQPNADLRVTISWNTDATDVDLWVIEPDNTKCFYQNTRTKNGGELSQDQTQGYGPERYQVIKAQKGRYRVLVNYFATNPNLLAGETHVNVVVTRFAGTVREETQRHTVILRKKGEEAEVCEVDY